MQLNDLYVYKLLSDHCANLNGMAVMLGSANLPFTEVQYVNSLCIDFNAAEGKRFNRFFPGCQVLDQIEDYGEKIMTELFDLSTDYCTSFEPLSGTQANQIVYNAILEQGDIILSLSLNSGGHPSHIEYLKRNHSVIEYHYNEQMCDIDYTEIANLCKKYNPKLIIAGASSYPLLIRYDILGEICRKNNCFLLADISHTVLYILERIHISPFGIADFITFTTHKTTRGPRGAILVYKKEHAKTITYSISPLSQGAPIFTQICAKVIMLEKLYFREKMNYCSKIFCLSSLFIEIMNQNSIPLWINKSDTHLCILNVTQFSITAEEYQKLFENSGIYVNACFLPSDGNEKNGLRFGLMYLATLNIDNNDFIQLCKFIVKIITTKQSIPIIKIKEIIKPYFKLYKEKTYVEQS